MNQLFSNILKPLKDYIKNDIDNDWSIFRDGIIEETFEHSGQDEIDFESHTASRWNHETDEIDVYEFETEVRRKISKEIQKVIEEIEANFQSLHIEGKSGIEGYAEFLKKDLRSFEKLKSYHKYRFLEKILQEIIDTINNFFDESSKSKEIVLEEDQEITPQNSVFKLREGIKLSLMEDIYKVGIDLEVIDHEKTKMRSFLLPFKSNDNLEKIHFLCVNEKAVAFLEYLRPLFKEWNAKIMEDAKVFITKGNTLFTQTNYNRSKPKKLESAYPDLKDQIDSFIGNQ